MLKTLGTALFGHLKDEIIQALGTAMATKNLKHDAYLKADALLVEAKGVGQDRLGSWIDSKRAELKTWAGE